MKTFLIVPCRFEVHALFCYERGFVSVKAFFYFREGVFFPAEEKDLKVGGQIASFKGKEIYPIENNRTFAAF